MASSGTGKWVVAATTLLMTGTLLTVFELRGRDQGDRADRGTPESASKLDASAETAAFASSKESTATDSEDTVSAKPLFLVSPPVDSGENFDAWQSTDAPARVFGIAKVNAQADASTGAAIPVKPMLRREGTVLTDVKGAIAQKGDRWTFTPATGEAPLILLENQLLERIEFLQQQGGPNQGTDGWILSGTITEFRKVNFLLVERMAIAAP